MLQWFESVAFTIKGQLVSLFKYSKVLQSNSKNRVVAQK